MRRNSIVCDSQEVWCGPASSAYTTIADLGANDRCLHENLKNAALIYEANAEEDSPYREGKTQGVVLENLYLQYPVHQVGSRLLSPHTISV